MLKLMFAHEWDRNDRRSLITNKTKKIYVGSPAVEQSRAAEE
jgi:hypothetical protein